MPAREQGVPLKKKNLFHIFPPPGCLVPHPIPGNHWGYHFHFLGGTFTPLHHSHLTNYDNILFRTNLMDEKWLHYMELPLVMEITFAIYK